MMEWGSILSGIGSIAGSGIFGGKSDGIDVSENVRLSKHMFTQQMRNLNRFGIHPVYGLGAGQGTITPISTQSGGGVDGSAIGQGLGDIARGIKGKPKPQPVKKDPTQLAMEQTGLREAQIGAERAAVQLELDKLELARQQQQVNAEPTKPAPPVSRPIPNKPQVSDPDDVHRVTPSGVPYTTRGGGVREDDLGGLAGEILNATYALMDPALNPFADIGKAIGKRWWKVEQEQERKKREAWERQQRRAAKRRIYHWQRGL